MEGNTRPQPPAATRHPGPPHRTRGAMSGEQANAAREWFAQFTDEEKAELELEIPHRPTKTGYINVCAVKKKLKKTNEEKIYYQAQLQVKGGGGQKALPGTFSTALEAAQYLALFKLHGRSTPIPRSQCPRGLKGM